MSTAAANSPTTTPTQQNAKKGISKKAQKPKSPKASKKPKSPSDHPPYKSMIKKALDELKEKKGASRLAILKFIMSHYKLGENPAKINAHLKQALKREAKSGRREEASCCKGKRREACCSASSYERLEGWILNDARLSWPFKKILNPPIWISPIILY
uniref:H15 domain-containing protein n=1 Tax=Meloidogyne enterolobii TaxID=390850 RepID=A0A6V7XP33_MELEN|nr:unnamed protein product [Meloidogyne enterolobii]